VRFNWNPDPAKTVIVDLETQSAQSLKLVGARKYLSCPSTRLMSLAAIVDGLTVIWVPEGRGPATLGTASCDLWPDGFERRPYELHYAAELPAKIADAITASYTFVAHNAAGFDALAWEKLIGGPQPEWFDTVPPARASGLPGDLDSLGKVFFGRGKDKGAAALKMLYAAKVVNGGFVYPIGTVPLWREMLRYNVADVLLLERVFAEVRDYGEDDVIDVHLAVNARGIAYDAELADAMLKVWYIAEAANLGRVEELTGSAITVASIRSIPKVKKWLASKGLHLDSLDKRALEQFFAEPEEFFAEAPESATLTEVVEVLRLRQQLTRSVKGKLERLPDVVSADGRLRDWAVVYGAHTGRWSSRGLQVHNFPRGFDKPLPDKRSLVETILSEPIDYPRLAAFGRVDDLLSTLLRPLLRAGDGNRLLIVDYASIEARGVAWVADEESLLSAFWNSADIYCQMASRVFGREITKKDKDERQIGKVVVLGCLAEGTPVLTDTGWKPIESVADTDRVWDGEEWVTHDGVMYSGEKEVIELAGVELTPDHEVLSAGLGWCPASTFQNIPYRFWADVTENGTLSLCRRAGKERGYLKSSVNALADSLRKLTRITSDGDALLGAGDALDIRPREPSSGAPGTPRSSQTTKLGSGYLTESRLASAVVTILSMLGIPITEAEVSEYIRRGSLTEQDSLLTLRDCRALTSRALRLIGSTTTPGMNRETSDSQHGNSRRLTRVVRTYDIRNAGPRHRFQAGGLIVHNCGYGMSAHKFAGFCAQSRIDLAAVGVTAEQCIEAYRDTYPAIAGSLEGRFRRGGIWQRYGAAAMKAVRRGRAVDCGKCRFEMVGRHLHIWLPSGRPLVYRCARIEDIVPAYAAVLGLEIKPRPSVVFEHVHGYPGVLYGGLITENIVQAVCRDILATALVLLERGGFNPVLHVHDEIVCEVPADAAEAKLRAMASVMSWAPSWAEGFPIGCEGFSCPRYTKQPFSDSFHVEALGGKLR
jgi:hypothetical protein